MPHLLFITVDANGRKTLRSELMALDYRVNLIASTAALSQDFAPGKADAVLADLSLLAVEPARLCHALKREPALKDVPLVLLVPDAHVGRIDFAWGLDDFIPLPSTAAVVDARLRWLRWRAGQVAAQDGLKVGDLTIDFHRYEVAVDGEVQAVTYKEYELLKFLATHPGKVFTREVLLNKVWGYDFYGGTRTVDVHVRRLRSKIETGGMVYIETVRNVGYKFISPESTGH